MSLYVIYNAYPGWFPGLPMFLSRHLAPTSNHRGLPRPGKGVFNSGAPGRAALRAEPARGSQKDSARPSAPGGKG